MQDSQPPSTPTESAFAKRSPAHTGEEGDSFQLSPPGEGSVCLFSFPVCVLRPWLTALSASSAPFVPPQRLVLLPREHSRSGRLSQAGPAHCPSSAQAAWGHGDFTSFLGGGPGALSLPAEG